MVNFLNQKLLKLFEIQIFEIEVPKLFQRVTLTLVALIPLKIPTLAKFAPKFLKNK